MNILAVETSSEACSCALLLDSGESQAAGTLVQRFEVAPRMHTQLLLPMVASVLDEAGLALSAIDCFGFGRGPGSFTGVRIAASAIQGLALSVDRPVVAVSTLAALAMGNAERGDKVLAVFDARMSEVYLGAFTMDDEGLPIACEDEQLGAAEAVWLPAQGNWIGVGSGWAVHGDTLRGRLAARLLDTRADCLPAAGDVARLADAMARDGKGVAAEHALPEYLRREVTTPRRK